MTYPVKNRFLRILWRALEKCPDCGARVELGRFCWLCRFNRWEQGRAARFYD